MNSNNTPSFDEIYQSIEDGIPKIDELLTVPVKDNGEKLIDIAKDSRFAVSYCNSESMLPLVGKQMLVRESVFRMLGEADELLKSDNPNYQFLLFYTYRAREVQQEYWDRTCKMYREELQTDDYSIIRAYAQRLSADPEVAGHPTGGSVDLTIRDLKNGFRLDMGIGIERPAFIKAGKLRYTMSPELNQEVINCRLFLKEIMVSVGFTAFDAEFWHFDYGNREWAFVSGAKNALYEALPLEEAKSRIISLF